MQQPSLFIFPPGRAALAFDATLLEALAAVPAVQRHAPALQAALQQALVMLSEAGGGGSGGGSGDAGAPGIFGVQAFTSDGQTNRTAVQAFAEAPDCYADAFMASLHGARVQISCKAAMLDLSI